MAFLSEILARKKIEVAERRALQSDAVLERQVSSLAVAARSLKESLSAPGGPTRIIAEVKRASPSLGAINAALDPVALATDYSRAGAAAISVLTDGPGFGGSLSDLEQVRAAVSVPLLRKDFIVDRYQLLEARRAGADVVLLIVAALDDVTLRTLHRQARALGLEVLVEVHDDSELDRAHAAEAEIIGINNRDLKTFHVDLATSERLLPRIDRRARAIAESGVKGPAEIRRLRACGAVNFLIGEALVRAPSAAQLLRELSEAR